MNLKETVDLLSNGKKVFWHNDAYEVKIKDEKTLILKSCTGHCLHVTEIDYDKYSQDFKITN